MALKVIDRAIQVHGAAGVTQFTPLAEMYATHAHPAHRRRPRRGPQDDHRPPRDHAPRPDFRMNPALGTPGASDEPQPFARP